MKRTGGFTLVEVIVALTVLSLISLATVTALRTIALTQQRLGEVSERTSEIRNVSRFLNRALIDAVLLVKSDPETGYRTVFEGSAGQLTWVAPFSASRSVGGLLYFRLLADEQELLIQMVPFLDAMQQIAWDTVPAYPVIPELDSFELAYFDPVNQEWLNEWQGFEVHPDRVRIRIAANGRYWPDIILRLNDGDVSVF